MTDPLATLLHDAIAHIDAMHDLNAALRLGGRTPEKALRTLDRTRDIKTRLAAGVTLTQPQPDAGSLREAFLAGVRRGASDGMEGYPMVADDWLAANPIRNTLTVERLARAIGTATDCGHSSCASGRDTSRHLDDAAAILAALGEEKP